MPLVTTPVSPLAGEDRVAVAGDAAAADDQPDEASARARRAATCSSAARPTKSPGLSSLTTRPRPASYGFVVAVELVAVERHAGLEPQRVAGAEADRHEAQRPAGLEQRVPELGGAVVLDEDLEAVLAGVAGPGDEGRDAGDAALGDRVVAERGRSTSVSGAEDLDRRAGPGRRRARSPASGRRGRPEAGEPLGERVADELRVAGVGDDEEPLLARR